MRISGQVKLRRSVAALAAVIDIALDKVLATMSGPEDRKFHWTCETLLPVEDWWESASPERRGDFLKALGSGQLEVADEHGVMEFQFDLV